MQRYVNYFRLRMKQKFRTVTFWVMTVSVIILLCMTQSMNIPPEENCKVLIFCEGTGKYSQELTDRLMKDESVFSFRKAGSKGELDNSVCSGEAECGIVIPDDFDADFSAGDTDGIITVEDSLFSTKTGTVKETVCTELYKMRSEQILYGFSGKISEGGSTGSMIAGLNRKYLKSGRIFHVDYVYGNGECYREKTGAAGQEAVRAVSAVIAFISVLLSVAEASGGAESRVLMNLPFGERRKYMAAGAAADAAVPSATGLAAVLYAAGRGKYLQETAVWLLFILLSFLWAAVFARFFRNPSTYMTRIAITAAACMALSPLMWKYGQGIAILRDAACIFPTGIYFRLISCIYTY